MDRQSIPTPPGAPDRMEGMVTGVKAGGLIFFSAIRGRNRETGKASDDTREQAKQAMENLKAMCEGAGITLQHVVKVTLYLQELEYRKAFHEVWMEYFPKDPPARIAIQVASANPAPGGNSHFALDVIALAE